jgi:hypothetical protein
MFGPELAVDASPHPSLIVGSRAFVEQAALQPQLQPLAAGGDVVVYVEPPAFLEHHRIPIGPTLVDAIGVERNAQIAVDGVVPANGTSWDSPASVILRDQSSALIVKSLPEASGVFVSVDGNDLYAISCASQPDLKWNVGAATPADGVIGMQTRIVVSEAVARCPTIEVRPVAGDGFYSIAEIGFLRR